MSETLYRKYRPKTFEEVMDQGHIVTTLQNQLQAGRLAHAYLFCGPRGVGKTTIARLLAKAANCADLKNGEPCLTCPSCKEIEQGSAMDLLEIDAASHTGVDNVREMIIDNVRFRPAQRKMKVFIIDEVHMLSTNAFNALLKTLEEPPSYALFILATTELHKVPETIISRCQRFDFHRIPFDAMMERLTELTKSEKSKLSKDVLETIARRSEGCLRDAESLLGQVLAVDDPSLVLPASCTNDVLLFLTTLQSEGTGAAIKHLHACMDRGVRVESFSDELLNLLHAALLRSFGSVSEAGFDARVEESLKAFATQTGTPRIQHMLQTLLADNRLFAHAQFPALPLEIFAAKFGDTAVLSTPPMAKLEHARPLIEAQPNPSFTDTSPKKEQTKTNRTNVALAVNLDQIKRKWAECCKELAEVSATLPVFLQNANLTGLEGAELRIACPFEFHAKQINETKNSKLIEEMLQKIFKKKMYVSARYVPADQEEIVVDLVSQFGGSLA